MVELHDTDKKKCPLYSPLVVATPRALVWDFHLPLPMFVLFFRFFAAHQRHGNEAGRRVQLKTTAVGLGELQLGLRSTGLASMRLVTRKNLV